MADQDSREDTRSLPSTEVYAVHGADPEVLAYAMAKYSRSALSLKESLREISAQRAEQFLNTFYFQYGHRSIADLAHLAFAVERLSLLAAIVLVDEPRWDGQERSTRYQNYERSGWYTPPFHEDAQAAGEYRAEIEALFAAYEQVSDGVFLSLTSQTPRPAEMKQDAYERTLRARAFDVARYLLPLATNTSLGQIVNARTLEGQVSRLLSHPLPEIRELGERLRAAASGSTWNPAEEAARALVDEIGAVSSQLGERAEALLGREVAVAPTLVKYAVPNEYAMRTRAELAQAAAALMADAPIDPAPVVDLVEDLPGAGALEVELAASLLYPECHYPYRQLRDQVAGLPEARRAEIIALGVRERGRHDELLRAFAAGYAFRFDILMDIGGFRDMHRHRRCVQLMQDWTTLHGFETPEGVEQAGLLEPYRAAMARALAASRVLHTTEHRDAAPYLLPLGTRVRSLFKMDFAQAVYIAELRSAPQGHFSYRRVAWEMYDAVRRQHPALAELFRVTDIAQPVDLLKR